MIAFLLKNSKISLDILLVVGLILGFTFLDPFGMFTSTKLRGTANLVSSVKSIGQLVTAEYYGEVISSLNETRIFDAEPDEYYDQYTTAFKKLNDVVLSDWLFVEDADMLTKKQNQFAKKIEESDDWKAARESIDQNFRNDLLAFIAINGYAGERDYVEKRNLSDRIERQVIRWMIESINEYSRGLQVTHETMSTSQISEYAASVPDFFMGAADFQFQLNESEFSNKELKRDIVFIGRGWVKAGFEFGQLDERNFYYDSDKKVIQFYGLSPKILSTDINPWFIPERKIKGFDLVSFTNKATFEQAKQVKIKCKDKLLDQARTANIIHQSKLNGVEALTNFFSLLLDEPELKVELIDFPYEDTYQMIAADSLVSADDAMVVNQLYQEMNENLIGASEQKKTRDIRAFNIFMNKLKAWPFVNEDFAFDWYSLEVAPLLKKVVYLTKADFIQLENFRKTNSIDDLSDDNEFIHAYSEDKNHYASSVDFFNHFNRMMDLVAFRLREVEELRSDTFRLAISDYNEFQLESNVDSLALEIRNQQDSLIYFALRQDTLEFTKLHYPLVNLEATDFTVVGVFECQKATALIKAEYDNYSISTTKSLKTIVPKELALLLKYDTIRICREIEVEPIQNVIDKINDIITPNPTRP